MDEGLRLSNAFRTLRTVRHLKPAQICWRIRSALRTRLWTLFPARLPRTLKSAARELSPFLWESTLLEAFAQFRRERAALRTSQADAAVRNEFRLSNQWFRFDDGIDWHREDIRTSNALAGFELHYQSYLEDLALEWRRSGERVYAAKWEELVTSWINGNPPQGDDFARFSWSPYVISERVRNWISSSRWLTDTLTDDFRLRLGASIAWQTAFLAANLERDLQANHLLQNMCGLVVALCFFGGWQVGVMRREALRRLVRLAEQQVLADGMHEERSFSYQLKVIFDLLDVLTLARGGAFDSMGREAREAVQRLEVLLARMADALASTWDEIGALPLLNDSEEIPATTVEWVISRASQPGTTPVPSMEQRRRGSGYLVGRAGPWSAVFDAGGAGPEHQMGHAHADHLAFELWHSGRKIVADSGNATYSPGAKRQWYRGTAAHNTVRIDGEDSLEIWSSFRVGRRPTRHVARILERGSGSLRWYGEHDGYRHLKGRPRHRRWFQMTEDGVLVRDLVDGRGEHLVESFLHLHPDVSVERTDCDPFILSRSHLRDDAFGEPTFRDDCAHSSWIWRTCGADGAPSHGYVVALWLRQCTFKVERQPGFYAPTFCVESKAASLRVGATCRLPVQLAWLITCA